MTVPARVLMVIGPPCMGGIERLLHDLASRIDPARISLTVCWYAGKGSDPDYPARLRALGAAVRPITAAGKLSRRLAFYRLAKTGGFGAVHLHAANALPAVEGLLARCAGVKRVLFHAHNAGFSGRLCRLHRLIRPFLPLCVTEYIACSDAAARWMYPAWLHKKICVLPDAVDAPRFAFDSAARRAFRAALGVGDAPVFAYVARFSPEKNHPFLLAVFAELLRQRPEAVLLLAGTGETDRTIRALAVARGLGESVRFLGGREDIPELLWASDVFLFPSLHEGFGLAVLEAQAAGLPALVSDALPDEACVTPLVRRMPLAAGPEDWARAALSLLETPRGDWSPEIRRAGRGLDAFARALERRYTAP